jgi:hypothetical protein
MSYVSTAVCGTDHNDWLKAIDGYKKEFGILEEKLAEAARKNNSREALAGIEHFQNQFIVQRNNIDVLRHNINEHMHKVFADSEKHAGRIETVLVGEHEQMKDAFISFEKVVADLRHEFSNYLSKWM